MYEKKKMYKICVLQMYFNTWQLNIHAMSEDYKKLYIFIECNASQKYII